jgi:hypothetical protein
LARGQELTHDPTGISVHTLIQFCVRWRMEDLSTRKVKSNHEDTEAQVDEIAGTYSVTSIQPTPG